MSYNTYLNSVSIQKTVNLGYQLDVSGSIQFSGNIIKSGVDYLENDINYVNSVAYDSGWFAVAPDGVYDLTHNLNFQFEEPFQYKILFSTINTPTIGSSEVVDITGFYYNSAFANGYSIIHFNSNTMRLKIGLSNIALYSTRTGNANQGAPSNIGYYRVYFFSKNHAFGEQGVSGPLFNPAVDNFYRYGNIIYTGTSTTAIYSLVATTFTIASDAKFKTYITDISNASVDYLMPRRFFNTLTQKNEYGLIAQEVPYPQIIDRHHGNYLSVHYLQCIPLMIHELKQLTRRIKILEDENEDESIN